MINRMISISRRLRRDLIVAEKALWQELRDRRLNGIKFRRQFPIWGFVADFVTLEARVTIELDGPVHLGREEIDARRSLIIRSHGFVERRYRNEDVFDRLPWVLEDIHKFIKARMESPHPSSFG